MGCIGILRGLLILVSVSVSITIVLVLWFLYRILRFSNAAEAFVSHVCLLLLLLLLPHQPASNLHHRSPRDTSHASGRFRETGGTISSAVVRVSFPLGDEMRIYALYQDFVCRQHGTGGIRRVVVVVVIITAVVSTPAIDVPFVSQANFLYVLPDPFEHAIVVVVVVLLIESETMAFVCFDFPFRNNLENSFG